LLEQASDSEPKTLELRTSPGMSILLAQVRVVNESFQSVSADGKSVGEVIVRAP